MCADRPVVVLVDAYGSGRYLQEAFAALGADLVHVWSTPEPLRTMRAPDPSAWLASLVCEDPATTARTLKAMGPAAVVAGQEPGVPLADVLSELLDLPTNGSALSAARRDKYLMIEALRKAGLRCADQFRCEEVEHVVDWAGRAGYPVVVKPLAASGSQGVAICADAAEVRRAAAAVLGSTTMYGQLNTEVLAQSYLAGPEYVVDTVSCRGQRYTSSVWRYDKRREGGRNIYQRDVLVSPDDPAVPELVAYTHDVLDALAIDHGPTHAEVMLTPEGPALVEVGARLNGALHPGFLAECCGADPATVSALAYCRPEEFLARFAGRGYERHRAAVVCDAETALDGTVTRIAGDVLAEIDAVPSVRSVLLKVGLGDRLRPTVDLPSSPLTVFLCSAVAAELERDYRRVRELCRDVFQVDPTPA